MIDLETWRMRIGLWNARLRAPKCRSSTYKLSGRKASRDSLLLAVIATVAEMLILFARRGCKLWKEVSLLPRSFHMHMYPKPAEMAALQECSHTWSGDFEQGRLTLCHLLMFGCAIAQALLVCAGSVVISFATFAVTLLISSTEWRIWKKHCLPEVPYLKSTAVHCNHTTAGLPKNESMKNKIGAEAIFRSLEHNTISEELDLSGDKQPAGTCEKSKGVGLCFLMMLLVCVQVLLICAGDVEQNPGPQTLTREGRPTLDKLAVIPLDSEKWNYLGEALGLTRQNLDLIHQQHHGHPNKCKWGMFRKWLEVSSNPTWTAVIEALGKIGQPDTAELVKSEYGIHGNESPSPPVYEPLPVAQVETDAGFHGNTGGSCYVDTPGKGDSSKRSAESISVEEVPRVQKYSHAKPLHSPYCSPSTTESPEHTTLLEHNNTLQLSVQSCFPALLERSLRAGLIDASVTSQLPVSRPDKAKRLLEAVQAQILTNPSSFGIFLDVLKHEQPCKEVATRLENSRKMYDILSKMKMSQMQVLDLDKLALEMMNVKLIYRAVYDECCRKTSMQQKALLLHSETSKMGIAKAFHTVLQNFPNTESVAKQLQGSTEGALIGSKIPVKEDSPTYTPKQHPSPSPSAFESRRVTTDDHNTLRKLQAQTESTAAETPKAKYPLTMKQPSECERKSPTHGRQMTAPVEQSFAQRMQTRSPEIQSRPKESPTLVEHKHFGPTAMPKEPSFPPRVESASESFTDFVSHTRERLSTSSDSYHSLESEDGLPSFSSLQSISPTRQKHSIFTSVQTDSARDDSLAAARPRIVTAPVATVTGGVRGKDTPPSHSKDQFLTAVKRNDAGTVEAILKEGKIHVDTLLKDGRTALMLAAIEGHGPVAKILLEYKASFSTTDQTGATALFLAANHGNYEVVKVLTAAFADVNLKTSDGTPILVPPAKKGFSMITELLLENGANPNLTDKHGSSPLMAAAAKNQKDVIKVLLDHGADVTLVSRETSRTALQEAVARNYAEIVAILVKATSVASEKSRGLFMCHTAESVRKLVREGAKVDERRGDGATPLIVHSDNGNREVVEELISCRANVDLQDENGHTALMKAARSGHVELAQSLITHRAILDLKSKEKNWTALFYAIHNGHPRLVKELLLAGADTNVRDMDGKSPLELANEFHHSEIAREIERHTAITDTKDPFLQLLSSYLKRSEAKSTSDEATPPSHAPKAAPKKREEAAAKKDSSSLSFARPTPPDEASTLKDQLKKAWQRVADLETRVHDLTLQSTVEISDDSNLDHLDRTRMETEYRKMKELKKKAEQYAIEAKQTAQRLSAENFKLKEDLTRERHHNELTRKSMIREMEQKMDMSATKDERKEAEREVFEQEVEVRAQLRARQLVQNFPTPSSIQLKKFPRVEFSVKQVKEFILHQSIRANVLLIGFGGLPFSGKSTLLNRMLNRKPEEGEVPDKGLTLREAVVVKDKTNNRSKWMTFNQDDAGVLAIGVALAQVCAKSQKFPIFTQIGTSTEQKASEIERVFGDSVLDKHFNQVYDSLPGLMKDGERLMISSLTFLNMWDLGVNKAVFEVLSIIARRCNNMLLLNVLSLQRDAEQLDKPPALENTSLYQGRYQARQDETNLMKLDSSLNYFVRYIALSTGPIGSENSTLLVGTFADQLSPSEVKQTKTRVVRSVTARAEEIRVAKALAPGMLAVDARSDKDAKRVKDAVEKLIEANKQFEVDLRLSWIFLRCALHATKRLFITKSDLLVVAKKCGVKDEEELDQWLELFENCGSIICCKYHKLLNYVILDPGEFIRQLDRLYYVFDTQVPEELQQQLELARQGFLSHKLAKHLWHECPENSEFYLNMLQCLRIAVQVDAYFCEPRLDSASCFFMPSLRQHHDKPEPDDESTSLYVIFNIDELPFTYQSSFLLHVMIHYRDYLWYDRNEYHYNVLRFTWKKSPTTAIFISFVGDHVEVKVTPIPENPFEHAELFSIIKTTCIDVFRKIATEIPNMTYDLAIVCPESTPANVHFVKFHPLQPSGQLFCPKCKTNVGTGDERQMWVDVDYQGPSRHVVQAEDDLSEYKVVQLARELSDLSLDDIFCVSHALGFTASEVDEKLQLRGTEDLLLTLMLEWRRRTPINATSTLTRALLKCGQYKMAASLDPTVITAVEGTHSRSLPRPLSLEEIATICTHIHTVDLVEFGRKLSISQSDVEEIQRNKRTTSEQCFHLLKQWNSTHHALSGFEKLTDTLRNIGLDRLAEDLRIGATDVLLK